MWNGAIAVGALTVPVKVFAATQSHTVRFRELHAKDGAPIEHRRVSSKSGREVASDKIVKGYETSPGHYVVMTDDEIRAAHQPARKAIEVEHFVPAEQVDPVYYDRAYYLGVGKDDGDAYATLAAAMQRTDRVAIGRVVLRSREQVVAVRAQDGILRMSTMRFADELVDPGELDVAEAQKAPTSREVEMAGKLVDGLAGTWEPGRLQDDYRDQLIAYLEARAKGDDPELPDAPEPPAEPDDLLAALKASVGS
jgi:DNA end-binding protein Ku